MVPGKLSEKRQVNLGRLSILACGTLSMLLTLDPPEFTLSYGGDIWGVVSILLFYPPYHSGILSAHPAMFGVIISAASMEAVSALDRRKGERG